MRPWRITTPLAVFLGALLLAPPTALSAANDEGMEDQQAAEEEAARGRLREAELGYQRGDFDSAIRHFSAILSTPVKLRSERELHQGFLLWAFTLYLMDDLEQATERLVIALRIRPEYRPSPVTTRPDLVRFYERVWREKVGEENAVGERLDSIFPELQTFEGTFIREQRQAFFPLAGIGLRQMGHREGGDVLLTAEIAAGLINIGSILTIAALYRNHSPQADQLSRTMQVVSAISMPIFYGALLTDFITSIALFDFYKRNPDKRRSRPQVTLRRRAKPRLMAVGPSGFILRF